MPALYCGTYHMSGGGGLHPLFRHKDGTWSGGEPYADAEDASFGTYSARHGIFYFVAEQATGSVGAFRFTESGWRKLLQAPTGGSEPCYVAADASGRCLAVANYGSGSVALLQLDDDGLPTQPARILAHSGHGPIEDRQDGPHAHCACFSPDQRFLYHVDLGTDEILVYDFTPGTAVAGARRVAYRAPPGSGPRHLAFHPQAFRVLLVSELASTLTVLDRDDGQLVPREVRSTLPEGYRGESLGGHLTLNRAGDRAYVSNRGHDSIAVFAWDDDGALHLLQHVPSGGASPRQFVLMEAERQLIVVHEHSANITAFDVDDEGRLQPTATNLSILGAAFLIAAP